MNERQRDERDLAWLKTRKRGDTAEQIAGRYGVSPVTVKTRTLEIRRDDMTEAAYWGDKPSDVKAGHWDSKAMRSAGRARVMGNIRKDGLRTRAV